jgi:integrase/recombinase XerD
MRKPRVPEHLVVFPSPDELTAVLANCGRDFEGRRDEAILRTFMSIGCRLAELAGLRYTPTVDETNDLDLDGEPYARHGKGRSPAHQPP